MQNDTRRERKEKKRTFFFQLALTITSTLSCYIHTAPSLFFFFFFFFSSDFFLGGFGSAGGHTQEMLSLMATLPLDRYTPRLYLYTQGDRMSLEKALAIETNIHQNRTQNGQPSRDDKKVGKRLKNDYEFFFFFFFSYTHTHTLSISPLGESSRFFLV